MTAEVTLEHDDAPRPEGDLRYAWFDGILEGPRGDDQALKAAERKLGRLGIARSGLEVEGGRFSLMVDDATLAAEDFDVARRADAVEVLREVVAAAASPAEVESTLRLTEVFVEGTRETLFAVVDGELNEVWRVRPGNAADASRAPGGLPPEPELALSRRTLALVSVAFLLAFALVAWRGGWIDRALAADAEGLALEPGPFQGLVEITVEPRFGSYRVTLARGADYPSEPDAVTSLLEGADSIERRAAVNAVADGEEVFVRLEDEQGRVLGAIRTEIAPFLADAGATVEVTLSGRMAARAVSLALDDGIDR